MKRTEIFKVGDFITEDLRNGVTWMIEKINDKRNGMLLQRVDPFREKGHMFLSNSDSTNYFIVDKNGEYDTLYCKFQPKEYEYYDKNN